MRDRLCVKISAGDGAGECSAVLTQEPSGRELLTRPASSLLEAVSVAAQLALDFGVKTPITCPMRNDDSFTLKYRRKTAEPQPAAGEANEARSNRRTSRRKVPV